MSGVEGPRVLHPARGELRPSRTGKGLHNAGVGGGAAFRQRRLRGAPCGGDVDADCRIGLGPDHLREFARFACALRAARAWLDQEVLAVGGVRRRIVAATRSLGLRRHFRGKRLDACRRRTDRQGGRVSGRWPHFLVDVIAGQLALDAGEALGQSLENALQIGEARLRAPVRARLFHLQLGQMRVERGVDGGRGLERRRAFRLLGVAQFFKELPDDRSWIVGRRLCRQRVDAIVNRVDLLRERFQLALAGAHIAKPAGHLVGDVLDDLPLDGRIGGGLELRFERAQQRLDRIEIERGCDRVDSRAKLAERRLQLARAGLAVREAVELVPDFDEHRLKRLRIAVGGPRGVQLGVELAQQHFDRTGVDRCGRDASPATAARCRCGAPGRRTGRGRSRRKRSGGPSPDRAAPRSVPAAARSRRALPAGWSVRSVGRLPQAARPSRPIRNAERGSRQAARRGRPAPRSAAPAAPAAASAAPRKPGDCAPPRSAGGCARKFPDRSPRPQGCRSCRRSRGSRVRGPIAAACGSCAFSAARNSVAIASSGASIDSP